MRIATGMRSWGLGGPEKNSNRFILLQTSLTEAVFDADQESDLHFEARGRTPEHKSNFRIEVPMRRFYIFRAYYLSILHILFLKMYIFIQIITM